MQNPLWLLILCFPALLNAQTSSSDSIHWCDNLSWAQAKIKAKKENKYLFVDCYATWCKPCKKMDKEVYVSDSVAKFINENFVAVRVQMDKTKTDNAITRSWYVDAETFATDFSVQSYPSFLFFDSNGIPVHKGKGYHSIESFISLLKDAFVPSKQYFTTKRNFKPGELDASELKTFIRAFRFLDDTLVRKLAGDYLGRLSRPELESLENLALIAETQADPVVRNIAINYVTTLSKKKLMSANNLQLLCWLSKQTDIQEFVDKVIKKLIKADIEREEVIKLMLSFKQMPHVEEKAKHYIKNLNVHEMLSKKNIGLLREFTNSSSDRGFSFFMVYADEIDSIMKWKNCSQGLIDKVISKEDISPVVDKCSKNNVEPNWDSLESIIKNKYTDPNFAERNVLWAQVAWCDKKNDIPRYIDYMIRYFNNYLTDTSSGFNEAQRNNFAWEFICQRSTDPSQIQTGIDWMNGIVRRDQGKNPTYLDTYANLLYKSGRRQEAIAVQEEACRLDPEDESFKSNLKKIKNYEPTWIIAHQ